MYELRLEFETKNINDHDDYQRRLLVAKGESHKFSGVKGIIYKIVDVTGL